MTLNKDAATDGPIVNQEALDAANSQAERERIQRDMDENGETDIVQVTQVRLMITNDISKTPVDCFEHEIPIYEKLHGVENVEEVSSKTVDVAELDGDGELDRLMRKFGKNGEKAVLEAFPGGGPQLAKDLGLAYKRTSSKRGKQSEQAMIVDHNDPDSNQSDRAKVARIVTRKAAPKTTARTSTTRTAPATPAKAAPRSPTAKTGAKKAAAKPSKR